MKEAKNRDCVYNRVRLIRRREMILKEHTEFKIQSKTKESRTVDILGGKILRGTNQMLRY